MEYEVITAMDGLEGIEMIKRHPDLVLVIFDRSQPLDENDNLIYKEVSNKPRLFIINKCDLLETWSIDNLKSEIKIQIYETKK